MNLYVHFPFCRRKCRYCALFSRVGVAQSTRDEYVRQLAARVAKLPNEPFSTVYFGGGSPALADLRPLFRALENRCTADVEFTVELHPLDVTDELLMTLTAGGVNRLSMGVQSLDDDILAAMGRGYTFSEAERAFDQVRRRVPNAGIDLIVGYPGETRALTPRHARLAKWSLAHCSVYSLILEDGSLLAHDVRAGRITLDDDDTVLNRLSIIADFLEEIGLKRYEISNYAREGFACRHNLATWRGEDYIGLGEGAHGRMGLTRTRHFGTEKAESETLTAEKDALERQIFRLRTTEGLDARNRPDWQPALAKFAAEGLLTANDGIYRLTRRGTEVCDSILSELL